MRRLSTASLCLGLLLPTGASAQQQVGQSGRALDANTRVGSGGVNPTNQPLDFSARNLLITGQVTGGRQFRGDPGFGAAGAFRGELGSDDLFRFRADSFNPGVAGPAGQRYTPGGTNDGLGGSNIIFNNYFSPSVGDDGRAAGRVVVSPDGAGAERIGPGQRIYNPGLIGGAGGTTARGAEDFDGTEAAGRRAGARPGADTVGRIEGADGRRLQVDASPLFGVSRSELDPARREADASEADGPDTRRTTANAPTPAPGGDARELRLGDERADPAPGPAVQGRNAGALRGPASGVTEPAGNAQLPREAAGRLPGSPDPAAGGEATPAPGSDGFARGGVPLAVQLGSQLNPVLSRPEPGEDADAGRSRLEALREQIFRPLESGGDAAEEEGSDPYLDLLRRLRSAERDGDDPRAGGPAAARPAWMRDLAGVPDDVVESAEDRRQSSLDALLQSLRDDDPAGAGAREGDASSDEARAVANQLGYDGPRLETLRGNRRTRINDSLEEAEAALAGGRYFDAELLYRRVVTDAGDQPLARVGLVHSQMAAGMTRSAALSLRELYNDHPELISARYAEKLLPPADRMTWLRNELQERIDDPQSPRAEPALLLAYLGRQIESRQLVRYGLALAEEARPADPLFSLLRAAWLGDADAAPAADGE